MVLIAWGCCKNPISLLVKTIAPQGSTQAKMQVHERYINPIADLWLAIGIKPAKS